VERVPIDLHDVLARAIEASRPLMDRHGHEFQMDVSQAPLPVKGDAMRLMQVFVNLLNNAAKYTPSGGRIRLDAELGDGEIIVRVHDNGRGIPSEALERVFELFMQVSPEPRGEQGGLGVGLALVRRIVELHGGRVVARSEGEGMGSTFSVFLPLETQEVERPRKVSAPASVARPLRVLVVDDNRDAADSLKVLLESANQDVRVAYDGSSAVDLMQDFQPELVLLDIGMPHMDGYEAARLMRAMELETRPTLIALTGWGQASDKQRATAAGFDQHFTKPVNPDDLFGFIASLTKV
jgi:two-component system CheB/CheR fusion protein